MKMKCSKIQIKTFVCMFFFFFFFFFFRGGGGSIFKNLSNFCIVVNVKKTDCPALLQCFSQTVYKIETGSV